MFHAKLAGRILACVLCFPVLSKAALVPGPGTQDRDNGVDAAAARLHFAFVTGAAAPNIEGALGDLARKIKRIQRDAPRAARDEVLGVAREFSSLRRPVDVPVVLALYLGENIPAASSPRPSSPLDRMAKTQAVVSGALDRNARALNDGVVNADIPGVRASGSESAGRQIAQNSAFDAPRAYRTLDRADVPSPDSHERFQSRMEAFGRRLEDSKKDSAQDCSTPLACFDARMKVAYNALGVGFNALGASFTGKEGAKELGKFAACNTPPLSAGCAAEDFYNSPSLWTAAMVPLSVIPGFRSAKDLWKTATASREVAAASRTAQAAGAQRSIRAAEDERKIAEFAASRGVSPGQVEETHQIADIMRSHFPQSSTNGKWYVMAPGEGGAVAEQGIKLRVADPGYGARKELLRKFIELTRRPELAGRFNFKVDLMSDTVTGTQRGKFITIYTGNPQAARELAAALDRSLLEFKTTGKVTVPSEDLPFGKSGLISWRYGSNRNLELTGRDSRTGEAIERLDDRGDPRANLQWAAEHSPEAGLDFWTREAGLASRARPPTRIELKANSQRVRYAQSGPIQIDLAGRKSLQIISYKDLPPEAASLGLSKDVGYFILDPSNLGKGRGYKGLRDGEVVVLGRDSPLRFEGLLDQKFISRRHLTIQRRGDAILIEDHSTHGTLVGFPAPD